MTHYMKHSLLSTRRVISLIITRNFFATRNKQPMTIGTNRMCISRDDNCANTMCFPRQLPTTARKLFMTICFRCLLGRVTSCVIRVALSVSYLLVSYFVMNFLRPGFVPVFEQKIQGLLKDFQGHISHISRTLFNSKRALILCLFLVLPQHR